MPEDGHRQAENTMGVPKQRSSLGGGVELLLDRSDSRVRVEASNIRAMQCNAFCWGPHARRILHTLSVSKDPKSETQQLMYFDLHRWRSFRLQLAC